MTEYMRPEGGHYFIANCVTQKSHAQKVSPDPKSKVDEILMQWKNICRGLSIRMPICNCSKDKVSREPALSVFIM